MRSEERSPLFAPTKLVAWILCFEALAIGLLRLASDVRFDWFAFFDGGAELTVHALIARGLRPTVDFGYIYGLLPLAIGEAWYRVVGLTPGAFAVLSIAGGVLTAWGIARTLAALRVGWVGLIWVMVAMPIGLISAAQPSLTHVLEPVFLTHAIAGLAEGRRSQALALASACLFVKPSMAYLVVASVLVVMTFRDRPRTWRSWARLLVPFFLIVSSLGLSLGVFFGPKVLLNTLVPLTGRAVYRANGFGFLFGSGRAFWLPERPKVSHYYETFAGAWLVAAIALTVSAFIPFFRGKRDRSGTEVILVCAVLHAAFLGLFFGNQWSWVYYFSMLVIGIAATSTRSRAGLRITAFLTVLCLPSAGRSLQGPIEAWQGRERSAETFGLWASPIVRQEWQTVLDLTRGRKTAILATSDGAATLDSRLMEPVMSFLVRGHFRPQELAKKLAQIRESEAVVVANPAPGDPWFDEWPEFAEVLKKKHKLVWSCPRIRVYWREVDL